MSGTITTISTLVTSTVGPGNGTYASYLTITNSGSILPGIAGAAGIYAGPGISNISILNAGTIQSGPTGGGAPGNAIYLDDGGTVTNIGTASSVNGFGYGVNVEGIPGSIVNAGTITSSQNDGVKLGAGGYVNNSGAYADISGDAHGIYISQNVGTVLNSGTITGTEDGGILLAAGGMVTNSGTVAGGIFGVQFVNVLGTVVNSGDISGQLIGVVLDGTVINSGTISGASAVVFGGTANNLLTVDPGAVFYGGVNGSATASNTLELAAGNGVGTLAYIGSQFSGFNNIVFDVGASWSLSGDSTGLASGETIQGFASTDTIDLTDFAASSETYVSGTGLVLGNGATSETLNFTSFSGVGFSIASDGNGGTLIEEVTCYAEGTRIATAAGELPVEALEIGMEVRTLHAGLQKIKWIGKRGYAAPFANHAKVLPVCIKANAIADNVPARDLLVSPGHAICIDGALVHASRLVNGISIFQLSSLENVQYFHIELEGHEVIFSENCPAETYMGEYFRRQFHNAAEFSRLYPGAAAPEAMCLPRLENGFQLHAIQRRIARRAGIADATELGDLQGYIDELNPRTALGWARNGAAPEEPVCLDILSDGRRVGRVLANMFRQDVRDAGFGAGFHGFEFPLPPEASGVITVCRSADGAALPLANAAKAKAA